MRLALVVTFFAATLLFAIDAGAAPISYLGGTHSQNFDGLPSSGATGIVPPPDGPYDINGVLGTTGLEGWTMDNFGGSNTTTEFAPRTDRSAAAPGVAL